MKITDERLDELLKNEESHGFSQTFSFRGDAVKDAAPRRRKLIPLVAAALAAAVAASAVFIALRGAPSDPPHVDPVDHPSVSVSEDGTESGIREPIRKTDEEKIPEWYLPGALEAHTVTVRPSPSPSPSPLFAPAGGGNLVFLDGWVKDAKNEAANLELDLSDGPKKTVAGRYVDVSGILNGSSHRDHGCLIYDTEKDEAVCLACVAKEKCPKELNADETVVVDAVSSPELISFAVYDGADNSITGRWLYYPETDELREVPVLSRNDFDSFRISPDGRFIVTHRSRPGNIEYDDVFLIEIATMEYRDVSGTEPTFMESEFSPDGKTLLLTLKDEHGSTYGTYSERGRYLLVDCESGASMECAGKVLSYADGKMVTRATDGYHVYDRTACEELTPDGDIFAWDVKSGSLMLVNAFDGGETVVGPAPDGKAVSPDGKYLYAYTTGDEILTCYSLSGEKFTVPVSTEFAEEMRRLSEGNNVFYNLEPNAELDGILICYYWSPRQADNEDPFLKQIRDMHYGVLDAFEASDSIAEALTYLEERYPMRQIPHDFHAGDGFAYLTVDYDYTASGFRGTTVAVYFEDYRNNTFTAFRDHGKHRNIFPMSREYGEQQIRDLASDAASTEAFINSRKLGRNAEALDYGFFIVDGKFSEERRDEYVFFAEYLLSYDEFTVFLPGGGTGIECSVNDPYYRSVFSDFMEELRTCDKKEVPATAGDWANCGQLTGSVRLNLYYDGNEYRIYIGEKIYELPESVAADFISLLINCYVRTGFRFVADIELSKRFFVSIGSDEFMTFDALRGIASRNFPLDEIDGYCCEILYSSGTVINEQPRQSIILLFPLVVNGETDGYLYLAKTNDGTVRRAMLLDNSLRFCADVSGGAVPAAAEYKGNMRFEAHIRVPSGYGEDDLVGKFDAYAGEVELEIGYRSFRGLIKKSQYLVGYYGLNEPLDSAIYEIICEKDDWIIEDVITIIKEAANDPGYSDYGAPDESNTVRVIYPELKIAFVLTPLYGAMETVEDLEIKAIEKLE